MSKKKKNMSLAVKILITFICVIVFIIAGVLLFGNILLNRINYVDDSSSPAEVFSEASEPVIEIVDEEPEQPLGIDLSSEVAQTQLTPEEQAALDLREKRDGVINVLLIGVDRRGTKGLSRSDTMLIATLDKKNSKLKLCSIMRDLYVPIPGKGEGRINSACAYGGPDLLMQTINENFSLDLTKYVMVDFRMFEKIVDKVGGVSINMSSGEVAEANDCIAGLNKQRGLDLTSGFITQRGGTVKLSGKQALGYSRIRHFGNGDYSRTSRQFKVLQAIFSKFKSLDPIKQTSSLYDLLPMIETNLEKTEIVDLMVRAMGIGTDQLMHYRIPAQDFYKAKTVKGASVLLPDINANAQKLHQFIYEMTSVEALEGSDTGRGTYHPKIPGETLEMEDPLDGEIDPSASGSPDPSAIPSPTPSGTPSATMPAAGSTPAPTLTPTPAQATPPVTALITSSPAQQ